MPAPTVNDYLAVSSADTLEMQAQATTDALNAIGDANFTAAFSSSQYKFSNEQGDAALIRALYSIAKTYKDSFGTATPVTGYAITMSTTGLAPISGYSGGTIQQGTVVVKNAAGTVTYALTTDYTLVLNGDTLFVKRSAASTIGAPPIGLLVNLSYTPVT